MKKIHLGVNLKTKEIILVKVANKHTHDLAYINQLLSSSNRRKGKLFIDGIGDTHHLYNKDHLTPPRNGATRFIGSISRAQNVRLIQLLGNNKEARAIWTKLSGYSERVCTESTFSR